MKNTVILLIGIITAGVLILTLAGCPLPEAPGDEGGAGADFDASLYYTK